MNTPSSLYKSLNKNKLFYGDNLEVLRKYIRDESVDLCYIDPPFNSKRNYNQIYNNVGREDIAQAQAFMDTWTWYPIDEDNKPIDSRAEIYLDQIMMNANGVQTSQSIALIDGLLKVLGRGSLMAYLVSMTVRIAEIYRSLKPTGSFYLHCDPTASHYLKLVCDAIFVTRGGDYRNEIIWKRSAAHGGASNYNNIHDILLYFIKSSKATWNFPRVPHDEKYIKSHYSQKDSDGRPYQLVSAHGAGQGSSRLFGNKEISPPPGRHWMSQKHIDQMIDEGKVVFTKSGMPRYKRYLEETDGTPLGTVWDDIFPINSQAQERLGYPTQKPEALLERVIKASSNEGDVILDAFCGCGTTVAASQKLKRHWIGIDITYQSISLIMKRLSKIEGATAIVELHGIPKDIQSVQALIHKKDDRVRKEFEKWAVLTFSDNQAMINERKGADKGIDGVAYTIAGHDDKGNLKSMPVIFSVKSGHVERRMISELLGTVEREKAAAGILITMEKPTKPMIQEAKQAGQFKGDFATFDKLQIVTVQDILDHKRMNLPVYAEVLKQAKTDSGARQMSLYDKS